MEVIKLKTPKGKEVEIPLSEKETDIEKPRITIIKNGKKLYAPLVKEKPKNKEAFIIVRTTDGINYYVGESKKEETSKITKYIGRDKGRELNGGISIGGVFKVPEDVHILKLSIGDNFIAYIKVNPEQKFIFLLYGKGMEGTTLHILESFRISTDTRWHPDDLLTTRVTFYQGESLKIECNGEIEKYVGDAIIDIRGRGSITENIYKNGVTKHGFDKVDNSGSGVSIGSDDTISGGDIEDGNDG